MASLSICAAIVHGKRYPRSDLPKLYEHGLALPYTVYLMDVTGDSSDPCGRGFTDGDPDGICLPIPGTLVRVPWAEQPHAQVLMSMCHVDGAPSMIDPRNIARGYWSDSSHWVFARCSPSSSNFYLLDKERDASGLPRHRSPH